MRIIYVDNNATTAVAPEVYEAVIPYLTEDYFNPSSMYEAARPAGRAAPRARPTAREETTREVPPSEMNGRMVPLGGARPETT